jgi:hypothetical protein
MSKSCLSIVQSIEAAAWLAGMQQLCDGVALRSQYAICTTTVEFDYIVHLKDARDPNAVTQPWRNVLSCDRRIGVRVDPERLAQNAAEGEIKRA